VATQQAVYISHIEICSSLHDYHFFHEPEEMLACMISGHSGVLNGSLVRWSWSSNFGVYKASENSEDLLDISLLFDLLVVMRMAAVVQMRAALMRCGLNHTTADYVMNEQGYDTSEELMMASQDGFDTIVKNAIRAAPPGGVSFVAT
jgi:hypothetical protein